MRDILPQRLATLFQPQIEGVQALGLRRGLPQAMTRILNILLDLPLFPACRWITELGFEQVLADHGEEAGVDLPFLAAPDLVHGGCSITLVTALFRASGCW